MRDMVMQMSGSGGVLSVPDEHLPGLVALVLIGPVIWMALAGLRALAARRVGWADGAQTPTRRLPFAAKVVLFGTLVGALVHAVIVPTHWGDARVTAILFIVDTSALPLPSGGRSPPGPLAPRLGRHAGRDRLLLRLLHPPGWETMDLVGLVTTTVEAAAALVVLSPAASSTAARRNTRVALAAVPVALVSLLGTNVIAGATTTAAPAVTAAPTHAAATPASSGAGAAKGSSGGSGSSMTGMAGMSGSGSSAAPSAHLSLPTNSPAAQHRLARQHVHDDDRHADGRAELHGPTHSGPAAGCGEPGQPDRGGGAEVHQPGGRPRPRDTCR